MLIEAALKEGDLPTEENLADSVDDPRAKRERIDPTTGLRTINSYAKRSFIADMSRRGRKVQRFIHAYPVNTYTR
jgi:hypothetical protein